MGIACFAGLPLTGPPEIDAAAPGQGELQDRSARARGMQGNLSWLLEVPWRASKRAWQYERLPPPHPAAPRFLPAPGSRWPSPEREFLSRERENEADRTVVSLSSSPVIQPPSVPLSVSGFLVHDTRRALPNHKGNTDQAE